MKKKWKWKMERKQKRNRRKYDCYGGQVIERKQKMEMEEKKIHITIIHSFPSTPYLPLFLGGSLMASAASTLHFSAPAVVVVVSVTPGMVGVSGSGVVEVRGLGRPSRSRPSTPGGSFSIFSLRIDGTIWSRI